MERQPRESRVGLRVLSAVRLTLVRRRRYCRGMRRVVLPRSAAAFGSLLLGAGLTASAWAQGTVSGRVIVHEKKGKTAGDVAAAVVWLTGPRTSATAPGRRNRSPAPAQIITEDREFRPRVLVVAVGATVSFPNLDPFNHNIFSTQPTPFDLGLYGRGEGPSQELPDAGLVRIFCNIHPRMSGFIHVLDSPLWAQPGSDGSFRITGVPAGAYVLHVWHERAAEELTREITVPAAGLGSLALELDASGYKQVQHLNKYGKPYGRRRERY